MECLAFLLKDNKPPNLYCGINLTNCMEPKLQKMYRACWYKLQARTRLDCSTLTPALGEGGIQVLQPLFTVNYPFACRFYMFLNRYTVQYFYT